MQSLPGVDFPGVGTGLVIRNADGHILLYKRLRSPEAGFWNIVGGKVDHLEHSADAAKREAAEETGLKIGSVQFLCLSEQIIEADRQHWVSVIYITDNLAGEPELTEPDKLSAFGWFAPDALPEPLSAFTRDAIRHLE